MLRSSPLPIYDRYNNMQLLFYFDVIYICAAEKLGIARTIPGFFDPNLRLAQLRRGVSFASGGSGYDDSTANRIVRPLLT